jgi:protein phosphatase
MNIISYSDPGTRKNNEDFTADGDYVFVLCDGVGGVEKGEVASHFVASLLVQKMEGVKQSEISEHFIQHLITEVQIELNLYLTDHPDCHGMGTTLCAVFISEKEVYAAHIGDSRIYLVKPDEKRFWRSTDHSVVAELIQSGILHEKDARDHYLSNQITRAIQAIPEMELVKADISSLGSFKDGDLLFLCSDGVNEAVDDIDLVQILCKTELSAETRLELIRNQCSRLSSDNHTAILLEFETVDQFVAEKIAPLDWNYLPEAIYRKEDSHAGKSPEDGVLGNRLVSGNVLNNKAIRILIFVALLLIIAFLTFILMK